MSEWKERASPAEFRVHPIHTLLPDPHRGRRLSMDTPFIPSRTVPGIPRAASPCCAILSVVLAQAADVLHFGHAYASFRCTQQRYIDTWMVSKETSARGWTRGGYTHVRANPPRPLSPSPVPLILKWSVIALVVKYYHRIVAWIYVIRYV